MFKWVKVMPFKMFVMHAGTTPSTNINVNNIVRDIIYSIMDRIKKVVKKRAWNWLLKILVYQKSIGTGMQKS